MRGLIQGLLSALLIFCGGCSKEEAGGVSAASEAYRGEGVFTDWGPKVAANRYVLKLDEVDFSAKREHVVRMAGLPEVRFWIGFSLEGLPPLVADSTDGSNYNQAAIHILLKTSEGREILNGKAPFSRWTWSGSMGGTTRFVYLRGDPGQGGCSEFIPVEGEEYLLTIKVEPMQGSVSVVPASLEVRGGGRKVP